MLQDASFHLDKTNTLFSFDTNHYKAQEVLWLFWMNFMHMVKDNKQGWDWGEGGAMESWGESFGRGSGMCTAGKAAVAAGCL